MPIMEKQILLKNLENRLQNSYSSIQVQDILATLSFELNNYDLIQVANSISTIDFLNIFLEAKEIEGRSKKTIDRYRYILTQMLNNVNLPVNQITVFHLRNYLLQRRNSGISNVTLEGERSVLSSFFGWLFKESLIAQNPCSNIGYIKYTKEIKIPFSNVEIEQLKESCNNDRDLAIVSFLLCTGCRISEVCGVNINDINFLNKECKILGKGNKERTVYLDDVTIMYLHRYLNKRTDTFESLFIGKGTTRMTPGGIRKMLHNLETNSKVSNVHPHRFRRTLATNLISHGMTIQEVAKILGHDKLDTTMKYVCLNQEEIKNNFRKFN